MIKFLIPILFFISGILGAQQTYVFYHSNVDAPLTSTELLQLSEVFGGNAEYVLQRPTLLKDLKDLMRNRIKVQEIPYRKAAGSNVYSSAIDLTTVPLYDVFNTNLKRDYNYKDNFNLLKYRITLFPTERTVYRIDNTYITVLPQFRSERK